MTEEYYEQYHRKGRTYVLPAEIFNELFEKLSEKTKILEELKKWLDSQNPEKINDNFVVIRLADIKKKLKELEVIENENKRNRS